MWVLRKIQATQLLPEVSDNTGVWVALTRLLLSEVSDHTGMGTSQDSSYTPSVWDC